MAPIEKELVMRNIAGDTKAQDVKSIEVVKKAVKKAWRNVHTLDAAHGLEAVLAQLDTVIDNIEHGNGITED